MSEPSWERHPADLVRGIVATAVAAAFAVWAALDPDRMRRASNDLIALFENLPSGLAKGLIGLVQTVALVAPVLILVPVVAQRRWRLLLLLVAAAALGAVVMLVLNGVLADSVPAVTVHKKTDDSWWTGAAFPSNTYLCAAAALVTAGSRWISAGWRHLAWLGFGAALVSRLLTAVEVPLNTSVALTAGIAAGSIALLVFGAPPRRLDTDAVTAALGAAGLAATIDGDLSRSADGVTGRVTTASGPAFVRVFGRDERDAALLLRAWRALRVKGLGDHRPRRSPVRLVEYEALTLALAETAGAAVPQPIAVGPTRDGAAVLALDWHSGRFLHEADGEVGDDVLRATWRNVASLQQRRIAHRALRADHVLVTASGPVIVDFEDGNVNADDELLAVDVAELLCSCAVRFGVERSVAAAAAELPSESLTAALPLLQPLALTAPTRAEVKADKELLKSLRAEVQRVTGAESAEPLAMRRITVKGVVMLAGTIVLGVFLLSIITNWSEIWDSLEQADWTYLPWILLLTVFTYVGGAISLKGSVIRSLPLWPTTEIMFGQSFLNRFTPANAGGMAMRVRYLQLQGEDVTVAAGAIGLTSLASGVIQVLFLVLFALWGNQTSAFSNLSLPGGALLLLVVIGIAIVVGVLVLSGWARRVVWPWVRTTLAKLRSSFGDLAKRADRMTQLFGGAAFSKLSYVVAFWLSVLAMGQDITFAQAGAVYMVGTTIGSAVPTPGGVGGVEAALIALLLSLEVPDATAAAAVLLFRAITYWFPTLPGYFFMRRAEHTGLV